MYPLYRGQNKILSVERVAATLEAMRGKRWNSETRRYYCAACGGRCRTLRLLLLRAASLLQRHGYVEEEEEEEEEERRLRDLSRPS
jgi:hypothetical protein